MLTRLLVRNFKGIEEADIELGSTVVLVGPNNSGKTSALQALALWQSGLRQWRERRVGSTAKERSGVTLNRASLTHTPVPDARALWRDLRVSAQSNGRSGAPRVFIEVLVEGQTEQEPWSCGFEFHHANPESIYCRPMWRTGAEGAERMAVPDAASRTKIAYLPPMSGLVAEEAEIQSGRIDVLIGEGQTAQVLRNLCLKVRRERPQAWDRVKSEMRRHFRVDLQDPEPVIERGSIRLAYADRDVTLDISSAGRGLQQALLLLSHIAGNPGSVLLFDEPDAHLEILRQREMFDAITDAANEGGSQVIAASHSEIVLDAAAERHIVIGFIGKPHRVNDRGSQLRKSLRDIPFDHYFQAKLTGSVLYLEGATDLRLLQAFADILVHPARETLSAPFVHFVTDLPRHAEEHYHGLREAVPDLRAFALFDRLERGLPERYSIASHCWNRREFENYVASPKTLRRFAAGESEDLFAADRVSRMDEAMRRVEDASRVLGRDLWGEGVKASEEVLPPIFANYYELQGLRNEMAKADYHVLAELLEPAEVPPEVALVLDRLHAALRAP